MTAEKKNANAMTVLRALEVFTSEFGPRAPISYARVFLHVALAGDAGVDQGDMVIKMDIAKSAVTRAVQALGSASWIKDEEGNKKPGLGLIDSVQHPQNFRLRILTLTAAGKRVFEKLGGSK